MAVKLAKRKPKWLQKISADNVASANRSRQARFELVLAKLELEQLIEGLNDKYNTNFDMSDIFLITQEEEQQAIDTVEGDEDDDE